MKLFISILFLLILNIAMAGPISNAIEIGNSSEDFYLSNRDIQCIKLTNKTKKNPTILSITLKDLASRELYQYTKNNIGKKLSLSVCGAPKENPVIQAAIRSGQVQFSLNSKFKKEQIKCLKKNFDLNKPCKLCPVCK